MSRLDQKSNKRRYAGSSLQTDGKETAAGVTGHEPSSLSETTAEQFFLQQKLGSKGIRASLNKCRDLPDITLPLADQNNTIHKLSKQSNYMLYRKKGEDICIDDVIHSSKRNSTGADNYFDEWLWKLTCNSNILVYGVGSKYDTLSTFSHKKLRGEDVIELNGNPYSSLQMNDLTNVPRNASLCMKNINSILTTISEQILLSTDLMTTGNNLVQLSRVIAGSSLLLTIFIFLCFLICLLIYRFFHCRSTKCSLRKGKPSKGFRFPCIIS